MTRRGVAAVVVAVLLAAGGAAQFVASTPPAADLDQLPTVEATTDDGRQLRLLVAASPTARAAGLSGVHELPDGIDGMWFAFAGETTGAFWMRNTPMPLDLFWLDGDGTVIDTVTMRPCRNRPGCPDYHPPQPYEAALEVPTGTLDVEPGTRVALATPPAGEGSDGDTTG